MSRLIIEGLPDAVAIRCLAFIPFYLYPKLELVCRSWKAAIRSSELFRARQTLGSSEDFLCVCSSSQKLLIWQLYDIQRDLWISLPSLPFTISKLSHFGFVSTAGKLFVIGGIDGFFATNLVWSFDPIVRQWTQMAPMLVPRSMFACCVLDGKIVVAGGFTSFRQAICKAESYDPENNVWVPMPDLLHHTNNSACSGIVIEGKMHVIHKESPLRKVEVLDSEGKGWTVEEFVWLQGPMAIVRGGLYVLSCCGIVFKHDKEDTKFVCEACEFRWRGDCVMIGVGDDLYVIGGRSISADTWHLGLVPLSDVDVLSLGNPRPTWRRASPMTKCRGAMYGCALLRI